MNSISLSFAPKQKAKKNKDQEQSKSEDEVAATAAAEKEGIFDGNLTAIYAIPERFMRGIASFLRVRSP